MDKMMQESLGEVPSSKCSKRTFTAVNTKGNDANEGKVHRRIAMLANARGSDWVPVIVTNRKKMLHH